MQSAILAKVFRRALQVSEASSRCDARALYGPEFAEALSAKPSSAFFAEGSPVTVYRGVTL